MKRWLCASLALIFYASLLPWSHADYLNYRAHDIVSDGGNITGFDNITNTGYGGTSRSGDIITKGPWVDVRAYGAVGNGTTDDTTAINTAIATGKNVHLGDGTFLTTGNHSLANGADGQRFYGNGQGKTTLKRLSGTNELLRMTGKNFTKVSALTFDGSGFDNTSLYVAGTEQTVEDVAFKGTGGTSYALVTGGCNASRIKNIQFAGDNYGQLKTINSLYTSYSNMMGGSVNAAGYAILITNDSNNLSFYDIYTEGRILIDGSTASNPNINFYSLSGETALSSGTWFESNASGNNNVNLYGVKLLHSGTSTDPMFKLKGFGVSINGAYIRRTGVSAGAIFNLLDATNVSIKDVMDYNDTAHTFISSAADANNITLINNYSHTAGAAATNVFTGSGMITSIGGNIKTTFASNANNVTIIGSGGTINTAGFYSGTDLILIGNTNTITDAGGFAIKLYRQANVPDTDNTVNTMRDKINSIFTILKNNGLMASP